MRTKIILMAFLVSLFGLSIYAATADIPSGTCAVATQLQEQDMNHVSPMNFENMKVAVNKTETGVNLTFTTDGKNVEALRERVRWMADMMNNMHGENSCMTQGHKVDDSAQAGSDEKSTVGQQNHQHGVMQHGSMMGTNVDHQEIIRMMHSTSVSVMDIDNGVQLTFVPKEASDRDLLSKHLETMVPMMSSGHFMMTMRKLSDEVNSGSGNMAQTMQGHDHSKHKQ